MKATAPDTRKAHFTRAAEIEFLARALKVGAAPKDPDPERHNECNVEMVYYAVFDCHHNDVVNRAVAAAKRAGGWGALVVECAMKDREKLNMTRAANARRYGNAA